MRKALLLLLAVLFVPPALFADCSFYTPVAVGNPPFALASGAPPDPATLFDMSRPAPTAMDVSRISFAAASTNGVITIRFAVIRPEGHSFRVVSLSPTQTFSGSGFIQAFSTTLATPLHFEAGDMIGAVTTNGTTLGSTASTYPGGWETTAHAASAGELLAPESFSSATGSSIALAGWTNVLCSTIPPLDFVVPTVADVVGRAHFTSDLTGELRPGQFNATTSLQLTLRDRLQNPASATVHSASIPIHVPGAFHADDLATLFGLSSSFAGPLIIGTDVAQLYDATGNRDNLLTASSRITATTAAGETGSATFAVGCTGIGRVFAVPFHVPANHRLNLGIASAQLRRCGAVRPATGVTIRLADSFATPFHLDMPAESAQLSDVTGAASPIPFLAGVTDGTLLITVDDEGSRIVAYTSLLDNTSQDSVVSNGLPYR